MALYDCGVFQTQESEINQNQRKQRRKKMRAPAVKREAEHQAAMKLAECEVVRSKEPGLADTQALAMLQNAARFRTTS